MTQHAFDPRDKRKLHIPVLFEGGKECLKRMLAPPQFRNDVKDLEGLQGYI
jgi:hypothetical protein